MVYDLIIIGAGAAGSAAAISAKDRGMNVLLLEQNSRLGKKILITGNGRCNISNSSSCKNDYHSDNFLFFKSVIENFSSKDTKDFFYTIGLPIIELEGNKLYPMSLQASSVVDLLKLAIEERNINIEYNYKVKNINLQNNIFHINSKEDISFCSKNLLICTGGNSYASTGSDGSGYSLAKSLGHHIITPLPCLVQLKLDFDKLKALSGIRLEGSCEIYQDNKALRKCYGELLFTDYGISGPPVLQVSRIASKLYDKKNVKLHIDLLPNMSINELKEFLLNHWALFSYRSVFNSLIGILNKKLIPVFLKCCGVVEIHKEVYNLTWDEQLSIINTMKCWSFNVSGVNTFSNAQVTCGGVDTTDVNNETLESRIVPNLYFAGEILDVDGDCGGFNLQWAWASAITAVNNMRTI